MWIPGRRGGQAKSFRVCEEDKAHSQEGPKIQGNRKQILCIVRYSPRIAMSVRKSAQEMSFIRECKTFDKSIYLVTKW
jgi:hypothetical protein